jgi:threonine/homoserine/homoserine lactone efflux protein
LGALAAAAIGIALSPLPFVLATALLGTSRGVRNAVAFVSGEALAVGCIATTAVALAADANDNGSLEGLLSRLEVLVGVALAAVLVVHLRRASQTGPPAWSSFLDRVGLGGAFAGGLAMVAVNPKNLALTLAGAASIVQLGYSPAGQAASVLTLTVVAVSALLALVTLALTFPQRSATALARTQSFVFAHDRLIVAGLLAALSAFFLIRGLGGTLA